MIATYLVLAAAPLPSETPVLHSAFKSSLVGARYHNGNVDIHAVVDLAEAGKTAEEQARSYFSALLGGDVEFTVVGVDHTSRGAVVHLKQVVSGTVLPGTHAVAVIYHSVLRYASLRVIQTPKAARITPSVGATAAADIASPQAKNLAQAPVLAVASDAHGAPTLVWRVPVRNTATAWNAYVDAHSGALLGAPVADKSLELVTK